MAYIQSKGSPDSQVWVVIDTPLKNDIDKGFVYSSGLGYVFDKMMREAGFQDYYVTCFRGDTEHLDSWSNVISYIEQYKPPIIIPIGHAGKSFVKELNKKGAPQDNKSEESEIEKYAGSILTSDMLHYPHYIVPTLPPETIVQQWKLRDQVINCDLAKAKDELDFFNKTGTFNPLPKPECKQDWENFDELMADLDTMHRSSIVSNDIETVYPRDKSVWKNIHPGYPVILGLANSSKFGISFNLFPDSALQARELWRKLNQIFKDVPQLGQNFFQFDIWMYQMLGFEIAPENVIDTYHRQHILWPELPRSLQFMTRQYTRHPYYKDEGHGWGAKNMRGWKHYNCLDVCVTFEVYEAQEREFDAKPHLS